MPRNGSGGYLPPQNSWNPAINGQQALPNDWMAILDDVTTALTQSLSADGQTPITGVLNFQGNRISNVGAPTGSGDALRWEQLTKGLDIASATTITIPVEGMLFDVTGTTKITTINDRFPGRIAFLRFDDVVELAHSTSLILPSGVNAETSAGDVLCVMNTESGVWQVISWPRFAAASFPSDDEPTITWPFMPWADTGNMLLKRRNEANSSWIVIGPLFGGISTGIQIYDTAGVHTWNVPDGITKAWVTVIGAGGGGGGATSQSARSGGGGGGGTTGFKLADLTGETFVTITVGAGGEGGTGPNIGGAGGASSFGALLSCPGGAPGGAGINSGAPTVVGQGGGGGLPVGADYGMRGGAGGPGISINDSVRIGGQGGASFLSGNVGGGAANGSGSSGDGADAAGFGGGGAGGVSAIGTFVSGGKGADGIVIIQW